MKLFALAGVLLAFAACGGSSAAEGDGTKVHSLEDQGFSVAVPSDWKAVTPGEALSEEELESFRSDNPEIASYIDAISGPDSPIKFLAFDPDSKKDFATNLNVVVLPLAAGVTFEQWAEAAVAEIEKLPSRAGPLEKDRVDLSAGKSLRLSYPQKFNVRSKDKTISTLQYGVVGEGRAYVLTFTTLPEQTESYDPIFRAAADSFRITG